MLQHDETALVRDLARVDVKARIVFASACAERLLPAYEAFCRRSGRGDQTAMVQILEQIWQHVLGVEMSAEQVRTALSRSMVLIPGEDDETWADDQAYADDAASAVAYALRTVDTGEAQEAAWAARRAYEAADHYVMHRLGIESELQIMRHPIVQAELSRQSRDLEELRRASQDSASLFVGVRDRSRVDARSFFISI